MRLWKCVAPGGWLIIFLGVLTVGCGSAVATPAGLPLSLRSGVIAVEIPTTPRQGYRATRGCRGLPGSEATENCRMLA
jgi:hypothetical protein